MTRISIATDFAADYISRVAGEKLRKMILTADRDGQLVEIDFSGVVIASTSFFDEGIAKLAQEGWDKNKVDQALTLKSIHRLDLEVLNQMRKARGV